MTTLWPNKSPEPTAVGTVSSAIAVHVTSRRWLSFLRSASCDHPCVLLHHCHDFDCFEVEAAGFQCCDEAVGGDFATLKECGRDSERDFFTVVSQPASERAELAEFYFASEDVLEEHFDRVLSGGGGVSSHPVASSHT